MHSSLSGWLKNEGEIGRWRGNVSEAICRTGGGRNAVTLECEIELNPGHYNKLHAILNVRVILRLDNESARSQS